MLHDDVERLIPGDILENQCDGAAHGIADDHVHAGELADDLQQTTDIDVLEIQRQLLSLIAAARPLNQLVRVLDHRLHFDDKLGVALIGVVLPQATRDDRHAGVLAFLDGGHGLHRGCEIGHVEPLAQAFRDRHLGEVHDQTRSLLTDVDAGIRVT